MRTDLVMGVGLPIPESYDTINPDLFYGSQKHDISLFEVEDGQLIAKTKSKADRMVLLEEPTQIPHGTDLLAVRESTLTLFEALGIPIDWDDWPVVGRIHYSGLASYAEAASSSAVPFLEDEQWLLMREREEAYSEGRYASHPDSIKLLNRFYTPGFRVLREIVEDGSSSETLLRLVGKKPYLLWIPSPRAYKLQPILRERLWDEHNVWFNWFQKPLYTTGDRDFFLERADVRAKIQQMIPTSSSG